METIQAIKDLMYDIDNAQKGKVTNFAEVSNLDEAMSKALNDYFGADANLYTISTSDKRHAFYQIVVEFLQDDLTETLAKAMPFLEMKNVAWGDEARFEIDNADLFNVVTTATGNGNVQRQRIENGFITIPTEPKAIRIFENFKRVLSGRAKWSDMILKVRESYVRYIKELVFTSLYASTPAFGNAKVNVADGGGFDMNSLRTVRDHVQAKNLGKEVYYLGTRTALAQLAPITGRESIDANNDFYRQGYYTTAEGDKVVPLEPMHKGNTFDFLLSNKQIFVMPFDESGLVKVVEQGNPILMNKDMTQNADMSFEFLLYVEVGAGVATPKVYGKYSWT